MTMAPGLALASLALPPGSGEAPEISPVHEDEMEGGGLRVLPGG